MELYTLAEIECWAASTGEDTYTCLAQWNGREWRPLAEPEYPLDNKTIRRIKELNAS